MAKKTNVQKINKEMLIGEVVQKYPQAIETIISLGLHCVGCHVAAFESLEMGFKAHGMDDKQVDEAIKKLNEAVDKDRSDKK
jgi:hybrid cluster-associated redox disulfide protein